VASGVDAVAQGGCGAEYEQGLLAGTTPRDYLHAKWNNACAYCDATDVPLNVEHLKPRSRGGSKSRCSSPTSLLASRGSSSR
jgi:hypothetical protein